MVGASNVLKDTIILSRFNLLSGSACVAYYCGECKKIIIQMVTLMWIKLKDNISASIYSISLKTHLSVRK